MWTDITHLVEFYRSAEGRFARVCIQRATDGLCRERTDAPTPNTPAPNTPAPNAPAPNAHGQCLLGIGYAVPLLSAFNAHAERVVALMPDRQGVIAWPAPDHVASLISTETTLPFADMSMDRIILMHALEYTDAATSMLRECWRILKGDGHLIVVVPNRGGLWSFFDRVPFGQGKPYSRNQLFGLLRDALFIPERAVTTLTMPPLRTKIARSLWLERALHRLFPTTGGVLIAKAKKRVAMAQTVDAKNRVLIGASAFHRTCVRVPNVPWLKRGGLN